MFALVSGFALALGGPSLPDEADHTSTAVAQLATLLPALPAGATTYEQGLCWKAGVLADYLRQLALDRSVARVAPWSPAGVGQLLALQRDYAAALREVGHSPAGLGDWWAAQSTLLDAVEADVMESARLDDAAKSDALRQLDAQRRLFAAWAAEDAKRRW